MGWRNREKWIIFIEDVLIISEHPEFSFVVCLIFYTSKALFTNCMLMVKKGSKRAWAPSTAASGIWAGHFPLSIKLLFEHQFPLL